MSEIYSDICDLDAIWANRWKGIKDLLKKEIAGVDFPHKIIWVTIYNKPTDKVEVKDIIVEYRYQDYTKPNDFYKSGYDSKTVFLHFLGFDSMKDIVEDLLKHANEDFKDLPLESEPSNCPVYPNMGWWNKFYAKIEK